MKHSRLLGLLVSLVVISATVCGQDPEKDIRIDFKNHAVVIAVPNNTHLNKSMTKVALATKPGSIKVGPLPKADARDELGEEIYRGTIRIPVKGIGMVGEAALQVQYQGCTEGEGGSCFPPSTRTLKVKATDLLVGTSQAELPTGPDWAIPGSVQTPEHGKAEVSQDIQGPSITAVSVAKETAPDHGILLGLLLVFLAGIAASFTPCVYPMIPITMAIIGAKGGGRIKGLLLSLVLVLGMAVTYTVLGVAAARSGATFGAFAQKPAFLIPVSILFAVFSLSLFGAFEMNLPQGLQSRLQGGGPRKGYAGAFLMGLVLGPLAAPCVGPIIGSVLVGIAQRGNMLLGGLQLFVFALGMGVLFLIVGTFSAALPRSGDWLTRLKHFMGLIVLGFAVWNVRFVIPHWLNFSLWASTALVGASVFGAFESSEGLTAQIRRGIAMFLLVLAVLLGVRAIEGGFDVHLLSGAQGAAGLGKGEDPWIQEDFEKAIEKAKAEKKMVLLDTYAVWCAQCKELDERTWPDPQVSAWIRDHAVPVKVDADKIRPDLAKTYGIRSFPTVILLDSEGRELRRSMGFQQPAKMLAWLRE